MVDNSPKNLYRQVDNRYIRGRASREKEIERQERVRVQGHRRRVRYHYFLQENYIHSLIYLKEKDGEEVKPRKRKFVDIEQIEDFKLLEKAEDQLLEIDI